MAAIPKKRLGELLVEAGVIDDHQLRAALGHQRQWGGKLGQALVDLQLATETQIVSALSRKLGFEVAHLDALQRTPALEAALKLVPGEAARRSNALPLSVDLTSITIAMSDPTNLAAADELSFRTGRRVKIVLAGDKEVARAVQRLYFPGEASASRGIELEGGEPAAEESYGLLSVDEEQPLLEPQARVAPPPAPPPLAPTPAPTRSHGFPTVGAPRPSRPAAASAAREAALREAIDRMVAGDDAPGGLRAGRLAAALARALLRQGLVTEAELLAELTQPKD